MPRTIKQEPVLDEQGRVIINNQGVVLKVPHKPRMNDNRKRKKGKAKGGRPKGVKNKPVPNRILTSKNKQLQKYKNYLLTGDDSDIKPSDVQTAVNIIRNRHRSHGQYSIVYRNVEDLKTCIYAYWEFLELSWKQGQDIIPDVEGVASFLGTSRYSLLKWKATDYMGFGEVVDQLLTDIASVKKQMALKGKIPPIVFATDFNNNHDYKQKSETIIVPENPYGNEVPLETLQQKYLKDVAPPLEFVEGSYKEVSKEGKEV